jgi:hypothetical protein
MYSDEWLRMMRRSTSAMHFQLATNTTGILIPYNERRVALQICAPAANTVTMRLRQIGTANQGIVLTGGVGVSLDLNVFQHGDMVRGPFIGEASVASQGFAYIETELPESMNL